MKRLFAAIGRMLRRPAGYLASEWSRMSRRERRLIAGVGTGIILAGLALLAYSVADTLASMAQENQDMRSAINDIAKHSDEYREAKAKIDALQRRIGNEPPQLAADLEAAAKAAGIQIPETSDRPDAPAGKHYVEHSLDLKLRKVDLKSLATFLSGVETGKSLILVTRLQIHRSFGSDGSDVDVDLTATTYEHLKDSGKKAGKAIVAGKGKG
ncbi:MAG: hypothetical protein ABSB49_14180 [Polyangia bacterium]|jgi:Tfp pilus assembly protein PilO